MQFRYCCCDDVMMTWVDDDVIISLHIYIERKWSGGSAVFLKQSSLMSSTYVIFTVNIPDDGIYAVSLYAVSCPFMVCLRPQNLK